MAKQPPTYAVTLEALEDGVHVPLADLVESVPDEPVPHDLAAEGIALGRPPRLYT